MEIYAYALLIFVLSFLFNRYGLIFIMYIYDLFHKK